MLSIIAAHAGILKLKQNKAGSYSVLRFPMRGKDETLSNSQT